MVLRRQMFNQYSHHHHQQQQQQQQQCSSHEKEEGKMEVEDEFGTTMVEEEQSEVEVQSK